MAKLVYLTNNVKLLKNKHLKSLSPLISFVPSPRLPELSRNILFHESDQPFCVLHSVYVDSRFNLESASSESMNNPKLSLKETLAISLLKKPFIKPYIEIREDQENNVKWIKNGSHVDRTRVREIILGVPEAELQRVRDTLKSYSERYPDVYEIGSVFFRLIPSDTSYAVLTDHEQRIQGDDAETVLRQIGVEIQKTEDYKLNTYFREISLDLIKEDSSGFGGRDDMGTMSCQSVVAMEAKERLLKWPQRYIKSLIYML